MIPYEIIIEITKYYPLYVNKNLYLTNKFFYELYSEKYLKNIIFIQKKYRKYKLPQIFLYPNTFLMYRNFRQWQSIFNRNNIIRIYRYILINLSDYYLMVFPEFVLKKAFNYNSSRYLIVKDWIDNNLPSEQKERTRKDILKFFKENRITFKEISDTGF